MTVLWTSADAARATGGDATQPFEASGISIDTRTLRPGDLFVALTDARDGHDFVRQALDKGAAGALVARVPEGCSKADPLLVVGDVLCALEDLGRAGRARSRARVLAITGSVGKTSSKEMLRAVLSAHGSVHAAEASFNNHWGVPVTLARLPEDADFAVIEIGMSHPGEISPLARLARPHAALITTVAAAHLEAFDDLSGIAREKGAIFDGLEPGGIAVIPTGLEVTPILQEAAAKAAQVVTFGPAKGSDYHLLDARIAGDATVVQAEHAGSAMLFKVMTPGKHFATNALGVLALAEAAGCDATVAAMDLGAWEPPAGRGQRQRIYMDVVDEGESFDLFDDAFNANPASMTAALEVLAGAAPRDGVGRHAKGRRVAILGDMLELGADENALHAALASLPAMEKIDMVHLAGPRMAQLRDALPRTKRGEYFTTAEKLAERARHLVDPGDVVMVKGSKGSKVSLVVAALLKLRQPGASEAHKGKD
ncbi:UDP-N-acetylmuramoyl-tripeptide--D-alanyl-D-alanine ligase [Thioclava dalianensis]|uniref:UDP-N-acetylmuramoyl-tripeptide--D-alanyl-D-alanine ligase n=1 Tax=Thioclava dalianensis TaxID=1185766 RepID=A0A074TCP5_9RHOB|nr:UDP-N-acetylmuramoyl-tripeptide--D-alanyl-D-alanine ligase [Thioclava dalianensis]KEP69556.1 UDP-N-acetylmuramoyl-tripeptide--D-alanyl-D-alanine ligase [Thioclava dalianensis]SFN14408.1 UDP-N-acetylmuramoyl-tripeptide--D-alanyl-D-alanine ligase [Thioclava dalianensis]